MPPTLQTPLSGSTHAPRAGYAVGSDATRVHGGPDALGVPQFDFSTNTNAYGPCPSALQAVQAADASRYPDAGYAALRAALAALHGVPVQRVLLAASASEFIFRFSAWVAQQGGRTVRVPRHGYGDYAQAAQAFGLALQAPPVAADGVAPDTTAAGAAAAVDLAWCCEPANPLGGADEALTRLVKGGASHLVLDLAYEPLRLSGRLALPQSALDRLWQLWTPNKALGLTGVRAAYVIAPLGAQQAVAALERRCPSWPLGAHGVALLQAWVQPAVQQWLQLSLVQLREWKEAQQAMLRALGWRCLPSDANFFCAQPFGRGRARDAIGAQAGTSDSAAVMQRALQDLRAQGIKLRDATSFGLNGHVRLSVQAPAAQDALRQAWWMSNMRAACA